MRLIQSFGFAFKGLASAWKGQFNLRIHVVAMIVALAMGYYFQIKAWEWCAIVVMGALVISLELINTALETLTDLVTPDHHPLAGKAKDISAAAVLVAAGASVVVGILIFAKYLF